MELLTAKPNKVGVIQKGRKEVKVSTFCFGAYIYFLIDFFLHLSARIPGYGVIRPTLLLVLIISFSLFVQRDKLRDLHKDPAYKAIIMLIVYIFISLPFVEWPGSVIKNNLPDFVKAVVFFFFTALIIDSERRLRTLLVVFVGCQVIRVLEPLYLNLTQGYWGSKTYLGVGEFAQRLSGAPSDVINPNELGFVIATAFPFLYYFLWLGRWKAKLLFVVIAPMLLYALVLTMSRGAMIAMLVIAWFIFKDSKRKLFLVLVGVSILVALWSVMSSDQKDRYLSLVDSNAKQAASAEGRINGMINEFKIGLQRPIFGHGLGTTGEAKYHLKGRTQAAHNLYAELLMEVGVVGAIIFICYMFSIYRALKRNQGVLYKSESLDFFYMRLNRTLIALFWMYAIYSINYWGLSVYYWYMLGGMAIAFRWLLSKREAGRSSSELLGVEKIGGKRRVGFDHSLSNG